MPPERPTRGPTARSDGSSDMPPIQISRGNSLVVSAIGSPSLAQPCLLRHRAVHRDGAGGQPELVPPECHRLLQDYPEYGEVLLPIGILRVGRMPMSDGALLATNDGRLGGNLWGVSQHHQSPDRVPFGTKISEIWRMAQLGDDYVPDTNMNRGVTLGLVYDFLVQDSIATPDDDLQGFAAQLAWKEERATWLGLNVRGLELTGTFRTL